MKFLNYTLCTILILIGSSCQDVGNTKPSGIAKAVEVPAVVCNQIIMYRHVTGHWPRTIRDVQKLFSSEKVLSSSHNVLHFKELSDGRLEVVCTDPVLPFRAVLDVPDRQKNCPIESP